MSRSPSEPLVPLKIRAGSPATEIFVSDTSFRRIAKGVDSLDLEVPPGFYKVRFRVGSQQHAQLVEVSASTGPVEIDGDPVSYRSAAPVRRSAEKHVEHAERAAEISHATHRSPGQGSRLLLLVRELGEPRSEGETELGDGAPPWEGVSLHDVEGERIAELSEGELSAAGDFGALSLELDPGTYRLRVDTSPLGVYEMFVVTRPDWQTQVFALTETFAAGGARVRRASLRSTSMLMARPDRGFDPAVEDLRLADLARIALGTGREIVSGSDMSALQQGKFDDPMLGIYAGHILLLAPRPDHELVDLIVQNLRHLLVPDHPDVEALELRHGASSSERSFETPPMLRGSWDLIVRASRRRLSLVPSGSVADRVGGNVVAGRPWLMHRVPEAEESYVPQDISFAHSRRLLEQLAFHGGRGEGLDKMRALARDRQALSTLERGLLKATLPMGTADQPGEHIGPEAEGSEIAKQTAAQAIRSADAPASSIARSTVSLLQKLDLDTEFEI